MSSQEEETRILLEAICDKVENLFVEYGYQRSAEESFSHRCPTCKTLLHRHTPTFAMTKEGDTISVEIELAPSKGIRTMTFDTIGNLLNARNSFPQNNMLIITDLRMPEAFRTSEADPFLSDPRITVVYISDSDRRPARTDPNSMRTKLKRMMGLVHTDRDTDRDSVLAKLETIIQAYIRGELSRRIVHTSDIVL